MLGAFLSCAPQHSAVLCASSRQQSHPHISKALEVNTEFDLSRQFWAYLVKKGALKDPGTFIYPVPHMSFVRGAASVAFLKKRFDALTARACYQGMEYSGDKKRIAEWIPVVMEGRDPDEDVAATRMVTGTDVNSGALSKALIDSLKGRDGFAIHFSNRIQDLRRDGDFWSARARDEHSGASWDVQAKFVFIDAGGGALLRRLPGEARVIATCRERPS
jgi:malate dehydrogenase (quinone)